MLMVGAYLFFGLASAMNLPMWLAILVAVIGSGGRRGARARGDPPAGRAADLRLHGHRGLASILVGVVEMIWTADQRRLPEFMPATHHGRRCLRAAQGVLGLPSSPC